MIKIEPRKITDRCGYLCMPLKKNVPEGKAGWQLTQCPDCGSDCWKSPLPIGYTEDMFTGILCTECAIIKR